MGINQGGKVFIFGCGGMLGEAVYKHFVRHCKVLATDIDLNEEWLEYADVRVFDESFEKVRSFAPDLIINLAALTDLEACEKDIENTWRTNALGAENTALIAQRFDIPLIYISTAGIFDGRQEYYTDFDEPYPLSVYAKAKYYGEIAVQRMLKKYYVFRAGWMMGAGPAKDKKFINKIFKQIATRATELCVVDDKLGTPTYTVNFAESMFKVVQTDLYGLYNMVCRGSCSRYDVAVEFVKLLGLEDTVHVRVVDSDYFKKEYFAPRPPSEKLVNLKLNSRGINYMRDWKECLREYADLYREELAKLGII